jgi:transcriptional regulator with XRE-family HTH domain
MSSKKNNPSNSFDTLVRDIKSSEMYDKEVARGEISDQIHSLMERQKVKPSELARRLGKSRSYITKVLQGNANFTIDSLVQIARALGCKYAPVLIPRNVWNEVEKIRLSASIDVGSEVASTESAEEYGEFISINN